MNTSIEASRARARMLERARQFFAERDVLEVDTPVLGTTTVTDPNIASIAASGCGRTGYLQTSPEFFMKRLLAAGYPDIYQVCKVFRDGETGRHHLPEFTMVEWYRLGFDLDAIMQDTVDFILALLSKKTMREPPHITTYKDAFVSAADIDPFNVGIDALAAAADADADLRDSLGDNREAWLDLVLASQVATAFDADRLTLVYHFPVSQAALARRCPADDEVADRFELYLGSLELANGFVELTDAEEQLARFRADQARREARGLPVHDIDRDFVAALESGLPPCAGVAVGFDRLFMVDEGIDDIRQAIAFAAGTN